MRVRYQGVALDAQGGPIIHNLLSAGRTNLSADAVLAHVQDLGATYSVVEEPYTDQDYTTDYLNFYAAAFRDYPRHTRRVHFFKDDVTKAFAAPLGEQEPLLNAAGYLGNVVVRPIGQGPIGRTTLPYPNLKPPLIARIGARADFTAHMLASELKVKSAAPFIQQDSRLGTCAQAAIWMASRAVHHRHRRTSWHSVAEITRLATTPTDAGLSRSLPAGSGGLDPSNIIRAMAAMGHQPLSDILLAPPAMPGAQQRPVRAASFVRETMVRYVDSGLPVIVAFDDVGENDGHAITAVGYVEDADNGDPHSASYDRFVRALIVHDDQRGPYRLLALRQHDVAHLPADRLLKRTDAKTNGQPITLAEASHMFVPLPHRVSMRAERADTVARDFLEKYVNVLGDKIVTHAKQDEPHAAKAIEAFHELVRTKQLVRRTYLTSAGRYRHNLARSDLDDAVKAELMVRELPHFVWVTELIEPNARPLGGDGARPIIGHMVVSAASSTDPDSDLLVAHIPHYVIHRNINTGDWHQEFSERSLFVRAHAPYAGRLRR